MRKKILASLFAVALLAGCTEMNEPDEGDARLDFAIATAMMKSGLPLSETTISNVNMLAYCDGVLEACDYTSSTTEASLRLRKGYTYNLYILANVGLFEAPATESELATCEYALNSMSELGSVMPMVWSRPSYTMPSSSSASVPVSLERLTTKIVLMIDKGSLDGLRVKSACLKQCAMDVRPFVLSSTPSALSDGDSASEDDLLALNEGRTVSLYALENAQGTLLQYNSDPWKKVPDSISSKSAQCTYLEVECEFSESLSYTGTAIYRMYLGTDNCTNFDLLRNHVVALTLSLTEGSFGKVNWKIEDNVEELSPVPPHAEWSLYGGTIPLGRVDTLRVYKGSRNYEYWKLAFNSAAAEATYLGDDGKCFKYLVTTNSVGSMFFYQYCTLNGGSPTNILSIPVTVSAAVSPSYEWESGSGDLVVGQNAVLKVYKGSYDYAFDSVNFDGTGVSASLLEETDTYIRIMVTGKSICSDRGIYVAGIRGGTLSTIVSTKVNVYAPVLKAIPSSAILLTDGTRKKIQLRYLAHDGTALSRSDLNSAIWDASLEPSAWSFSKGDDGSFCSCEKTLEVDSMGYPVFSLWFTRSTNGLGARFSGEDTDALSISSALASSNTTISFSIPKVQLDSDKIGEVHDWSLLTTARTDLDAECYTHASYSFDLPGVSSASAGCTVQTKPVYKFSDPCEAVSFAVVASGEGARLTANVRESLTDSHAIGPVTIYINDYTPSTVVARALGVVDIYVHTAIGGVRTPVKHVYSYGTLPEHYYYEVAAGWATKTTKCPMLGYVADRVRDNVSTYPYITLADFPQGTEWQALTYYVYSETGSKGLGSLLYIRRFLAHDAVSWYSVASSSSLADYYYNSSDEVPFIRINAISESGVTEKADPYWYAPFITGEETIRDAEGKGYLAIHQLLSISSASKGWLRSNWDGTAWDGKLL